MNRDGRLVIAAVVLVAIAAIAAVGIVSATQGVERGEPNIDVYLSDNEVQTGTTETIEIDVGNDATVASGSGEQVTTARGVSVEIQDAGPFEAKSAERAIGPIQDGQVATAPMEIDVPRDIEPGEHTVTVRVRYAYTNRVSGGDVQRLTKSERHSVTVVVPDEPRFEIDDVETDVEPGGSGEATIGVRNVGTETATDLRTAISGGTGISVDGSTAEAPAEELLGELDPGRSTEFTVDVAIEESVSAGEKPLQLEFTYRDESGIERQGETETASLVPASEQSFSISDLEDTLSVGYDGEVTGELTNDGPRAVDDAVLIVEPMSDSLYVEDTRYAVPELEAGESTTFRYPTDVSGQADPGPRQLRFTVEYTSGDRSTLTDGPISERVVVDDERDEFSLETVSATVGQGETSDLVLEVTNERPETLSSVDARLYTDSPLDTTNDEAFVPELEPGESAEIRFDVSAAGDASAELHPVELDFQYDTERGDTVVSDTYLHPVEVEAVEDDGGTSLGSILVRGMAVLTVAGLGIGFWWRRR
ncbi:hypothetical protein EA462_10825 [Natrarchaeobius halalkaliphilus]|uniref:Alpha-galactosidase NEW3 domain-containing protein n=1 Tax=Natrarchaeobius halalkaliphilus TaxID=1679091 RepID=A0A3N6LMX8_9EURY|nr:COG1361 S-layer family protein [Natrarchaeobius halalkaliphilus]RQG89267.1 hypothetical protein EA462_10825 [Natrarchaeobius halalkaliphilus]